MPIGKYKSKDARPVYLMNGPRFIPYGICVVIQETEGSYLLKILKGELNDHRWRETGWIRKKNVSFGKKVGEVYSKGWSNEILDFNSILKNLVINGATGKLVSKKDMEEKEKKEEKIIKEKIQKNEYICPHCSTKNEELWDDLNLIVKCLECNVYFTLK